MKNVFFTINLLFMSVLIACSAQNKIQVASTKTDNPVQTSTEKIIEQVEPRVYSVKMRVVGDIMVHKWQLWEAYDKSNDTYNFNREFDLIKPFLYDADITIGNLETTFGGKERGYSGYPRFNSPDSLGNTLKEVGFDILTTSNNHSMDSNAKGVIRTLDVLDQIGIEHVGTYRNQNESEKIKLKTVNGISFAFLSYTYGTNGIPIPKEQAYLVNLIDVEKIKSDIKKAEDMNPDFIIVYLHFGQEYQRYPNKNQNKIVDEIFEAGADVILGGHPHVIQPMETRELIREDGTKETGFLIYSLGNFISSQRTPLDPPRDAGIILNLDFEKINDEKAIIKNISFMPTWVQFSNRNGKRIIRIIGDNVSNEELNLTQGEINRLESTRSYTIKHLLGEKEVKKDNNFYIYYLKE
ncbi:CapA family protein [Defluviitalea phaphyphila]|uniref:CapA family protein n=1 Tax=Defluviitalea phaphyphila TaxID=1473580 RepID=UPI0007318661|nr:CapA family protein [Defluviitalea phaphyphila]